VANMNFNATINVLTFNPTTGNQYQIEAQILDYTGLFSSSSVSVGDYIFVNGTQNGNPLVMIYHVDSIVTNTTPPNVTVLATYVGPDVGPFDPVGEALIAKPSSSGVVDIPDATTFQLSSLFVNAVRNYEIDTLNSSIPTDVMETKVYDPTNSGVIGGTQIGLVDGGVF